MCLCVNINGGELYDIHRWIWNIGFDVMSSYNHWLWLVEATNSITFRPTIWFLLDWVWCGWWCHPSGDLCAYSPYIDHSLTFNVWDWK